MGVQALCQYERLVPAVPEGQLHPILPVLWLSKASFYSLT